jgi:hypothetical protein
LPRWLYRPSGIPLYFYFASGVAELVVFTKQLKQVLTLYLTKQKYFGGTNARVQGKHLMLLRIYPQ